MRNRSFFNIDHANSYLSGSIIRFDETPIYIYEVLRASNGKEIIRYAELPLSRNEARNSKTISRDSKHINMEPVPLGLLATTRQSPMYPCLISRSPRRNWKIGLCSASAYFTAIPFAKDRTFPIEYNFTNFLYTQEFVDTILGKYAPLTVALKETTKGGKPIPFSRRFYLFDGKLFYRTLGEVGKVRNFDIELDEKHRWLTEVLREDLDKA